MRLPRPFHLLLLGLLCITIRGESLSAREGSASLLRPGPHDVVVNGVRLWYRVAGKVDGTPMVFLHGGPGQGSQSFASLAGKHLERFHRIVYLDQRGSGRSERPWNEAYSLELFTEDLEQLRTLWRVPRMDLIGHSFGTVLALEYAAKYPHRAAHVILAAAVPDFPAMLDGQCARLERADPEAYARAVAGLQQGSQRRCNMFRAYAGEARQAAVNRNMFPKVETERLVEEADTAGGLRNTGQVGRALFGSGLLDYRFERPDRLTMPVLVIAGLADYQALVEPQRDLVRKLPDAEILEYAGHGHFMFVEDPLRFARDVTAFLRRR